MIIYRDITPFIVFSEDDVVTALQKINANKKGFVLCLSASGRLEGVLTDGDVRRWLTEAPIKDFSVRALDVANREFTSLGANADENLIAATLSERITFVPIVDDQLHLVAIASGESGQLRIGDRAIGENEPAYLIAEIGNNHNGDLDLAKRLIDLAAQAGADCAKFQMRDMEALYRNSGDADDEAADLGAQYTLDLLAKFQLGDDELIEAFDHCKAHGIQPLCTPWDEASLAKLEAYGMPAYKLASADLTNHRLLKAMAATGKVLICSTGMSHQSEIHEAVTILRERGAPFVLLHCNSTYPAPFKDINLAYLKNLAKIAGGVVGYSGHERGYHVPVAAVAMGAKVIEKHFTVDRNMEGNDHRVSLLPDEFKAMVDNIREVEMAIGSDNPRGVTQGELMNREILAKSVVAARPILKGAIITDSDLELRSPGQGVQPNRRDALIGLEAKRSFETGDVFFPSDLADERIIARDFIFKRPFGIPVRYHDFEKLARTSNLDLVEFHLSYKDMEIDIDQRLGGQKFDLALAVHSPELFRGDHVMDLCSSDAAYRNRSIDELQRVVDITRQLKTYFVNSGPPPIVINAGGFSADGPIPESQRPAMYELVGEALTQIDSEGVEIIPQTMPPYPWHFGGQRYHNLFMTASDILSFCQQYGMRICLDVSHSALAANHGKTSFAQFLEAVGPVTRHLHIVDAEGVDGEGLQIGEGTIDFAMVADILDRTAPEASFIPEIWQGHKDDGAGFWRALDRLEQWF